MKPILCIIDLTKSSVNVLEVAATMALANKAYLNILFPYRLIDYNYKGDLGKLKAKLELEAREKFCLIKKQVTSMNHVSYEFVSEIGFAWDRINSRVNKNKFDMVIIGQLQADTISEIQSNGLQNLITNSNLSFTIVPEKKDDI